MTDESNVGVWLWLGLVVLVNAYWIISDILLDHFHHEFLTTEMKEGLNNSLWGPLIVGFLAFTIAAFCWHMFTARQGIQ